ncbi:hypothetical protein FGO68_gene2919 [Halteria grandinella]|uniref:RING-type domain-containing protein n=1 Tax=Halteria grandinella TaxID=5974 RepID=A0A8J8NNM8_HALGN|nr:hypothetical protein FGO68_gene2919 [Halteria grandinella]
MRMNEYHLNNQRQTPLNLRGVYWDPDLIHNEFYMGAPRNMLRKKAHILQRATHNLAGPNFNRILNHRDSMPTEQSLERDLKLVDKLIIEEQALLLRKIQDEYTSEKHTCQICMEGYQLVERVPVVLGCGHTLCVNCAKPMLKFDQIKCPFCNKQAKGQADSLPKNFALIQLIEEEKWESKNMKGETLGMIEQSDEKEIIGCYLKQVDLKYEDSQISSEEAQQLKERIHQVTLDFMNFVKLAEEMKEGYDCQILSQGKQLIQHSLPTAVSLNKQDRYKWEKERFDFERGVNRAQFLHFINMEKEDEEETPRAIQTMPIHVSKVKGPQEQQSYIKQGLKFNTSIIGTQDTIQKDRIDANDGDNDIDITF